MARARAEAIAAELLADPAQLKARILAEKARRSGARTFAAFVKQAWEYVPSVDPLVWGWHMDAMCSHLEEVAHGRIPKLLINVPPGHAKSVLMSVLWPAWIWTWWPKAQYIGASYAAELAVRDSVRCRAVIESEWYREMHSGPAGWTLRSDQNAKGYFVNTVGGERFSTGIGGTGRRSHIIGIDDPLDAVEAHSKAARDNANEWIGQTLSQRFVDPKRPKMAMIMQRLHEEDPSGFVLQGKDWEHLMLPSEFEPDRRAVTFHYVERANDNGTLGSFREEFWRDPRTDDGALLFPERFPKDVLESFKQPNALGADGYAGQHGQSPTPAGGGMFKKADWRFYKPDGAGAEWNAPRPKGCTEIAALPLPKMDREIVSVDAAFKDNPAGSKVAIHVWGRRGADRFLLFRQTEHMDYSTTKKNLKTICKMFPRARTKIVEDKANGTAIVNDLAHDIPGFIAVEPEGGKEARAAVGQPYQRAGNVYLPDGAPWVDEYVGIFAAFPKGKENDDVDAQSQALRELEDDDTTATKWARMVPSNQK